MSVIEATPTVVTESGLYDMAPEVYHGDPVPVGSLSQSRAKVLLEEAGPAKFRYREDSGDKIHSAAFDLGTVAHALVLGKGMERVVLIDADDYRTVRSRDARDAAYAAGQTPVLRSQMRQAEDMAEALARNPLAVETLRGQSEVAMFHQVDGGLWLRGQIDSLADDWTADYKTCADASTVGFTRSVWKYGYHMQAAWYRRLRGWLTGDWLPYRLVAQEKTAPYLVSVWEPTADYIELGDRDMDDAIAIYRRCTESGEWPGYPAEVQQLMPPEWAYDDDIELED